MGDQITDELHDPCPDFAAVRIALCSLQSSKPLQNLLIELTGAIDPRTVGHLTKARDVA